MASSLQAIALPNMDFEKIRKTKETPPRVSVYDLIEAISKVQNPRVAWTDLQKRHPEVVCQTYNFNSEFQFPGRRQRGTPVINARGAILIINLLPGSMAASFRAAWADIIVRYIGGDETLKVEIERNAAIQNELPKNDPVRIFREDVEARHIPKSVTGVQDIRSAQIYFGIAGPPDVWTEIRRSDGTPYKLKDNEFLIKAGYHDENTGRYGQHVSEYGFFRLSDSVLGRNPRIAEQKMKGWLRNENLLLSARHVNKTTRDTELIAVTLVRYKETVGKAIEFFKNDENNAIHIDYERELTKRTLSDNEVRKLELQLEMMKLQQPPVWGPISASQQVNPEVLESPCGHDGRPGQSPPSNHDGSIATEKRPTGIYEHFCDHLVERCSSKGAHFTLKQAKSRWEEFAAWMVDRGIVSTTLPIPRERDLREGLVRVLKTKCHKDLRIPGRIGHSVFLGFILRDRKS